MKSTRKEIITDPKIRFGKPTILGTRITVDEVLGALAGGMTQIEVQAEYGLTLKQISAALKFAASWTEREVMAEYEISTGR